MLRILILVVMFASANLQAASTTPAAQETFIGGNFKLIDQNREEFDNTKSNKQYSLVFFGYGTCKSICPTAMADLTSVLNAYPKVSTKIQPVFISLEPSKDNPELLKKFAQSFNSSIKMLTSLDNTGDAYVKKLSTQYKAYNERIILNIKEKEELGEDNDYVISHSNFFYLINNKTGELINFSPTNQNGLKDLLLKYGT